MVMAFLGPALRRHHFRNIRAITLGRYFESFQPDPLTLSIERCGHNLVDEQLNVLGKIRSQPLANTAPELTVDEITAINKFPVLRVTVVHQVQMICPAFTCIAGLADESLTE